MSDDKRTASDTADGQVSASLLAAAAGLEPNFIPAEIDQLIAEHDQQKDAGLEADQELSVAGAGHDPNFLPMEVDRALNDK